MFSGDSFPDGRPGTSCEPAIEGDTDHDVRGTSPCNGLADVAEFAIPLAPTESGEGVLDGLDSAHNEAPTDSRRIISSTITPRKGTARRQNEHNRGVGRQLHNRQPIHKNEVTNMVEDKDQRERWKDYSEIQEKLDQNVVKMNQQVGSLTPEEREKFWTESRSPRGTAIGRASGHHDRMCASCAIECQGGRCPLPGTKNPTQIIYEGFCYRKKDCAEREAKGRCPRPCPHYVLTDYGQWVSHDLAFGLIARLVAEGIDLKTWTPKKGEADEFRIDP